MFDLVTAHFPRPGRATGHYSRVDRYLRLAAFIRWYRITSAVGRKFEAPSYSESLSHAALAALSAIGGAERPPVAW